MPARRERSAAREQLGPDSAGSCAMRPMRSAARSGSRRTPASAPARVPGIAASGSPRRAGVGQRAQQRLRIGMLRRARRSRPPRRPRRSGPAYISATRCAMPRDDAEVVRDQQQAHALLALQVAQQVEDLLLDRHVERGGRLVGDQEVGLGGQRRSRSSRAASGRRSCGTGTSSMRALGLGDADALRAIRCALARAAAPRSVGVRLDRLDDLVADLHHRIERRWVSFSTSS